MALKRIFTEAWITLSDTVTGNVSTLMHGFAPKLPGDGTKYLDGNGNYTVPAGGGGGGGGTVTNISSTSADLTVANPTTTPALTVVSAPKLTTARNINGVAFDGTGNITVADATKQPVDAGLTSISALTGSGYVKETATDTFSLVSTIPNTDITGLGTLSTQSGTFSGTSSGTNSGDQTITLTGGVTGSGTGSFAATVVTNANMTGDVTSVGNATTLATVNSNVGSFGLAGSVSQFVVNAKGLITSAVNVAISITASQVSDFSAGVRAVTLTGLSLATSQVIAATDTVLLSLGYLQAQITALTTTVSGKVGTSRTISVVGPISGGGDLSADRTITTSMATNKLIGRGTAGTGVMEEITLGTGLSFTGTTLNASGSGGTITTQDEGSTLSTTVTTLNFVGAGVTASGSGATTTITIPGGGGGATANQQSITSTGQTVFNLSFSYTVGDKGLSVFINGVRQTITTHYTESSTTQVTFTSTVTSGNVVDFVYGTGVGATGATGGTITLVKGASTLNFGSTPGTSLAVTTITGQTAILSTSNVKAYLVGIATATHNIYEHMIVPLTITCGNIVVGTGFDIYASSPQRLDGTFNIVWEFTN